MNASALHAPASRFSGEDLPISEPAQRIAPSAASDLDSLVKDLITPIVAALAGKHDFSTLSFAINGSRFLYGDFINAVITFVSVAAAVFFFVVKPVNALTERWKTDPPVDENVRPCPECLSAIPRAARRCSFCAVEVAPA